MQLYVDSQVRVRQIGYFICYISIEEFELRSVGLKRNYAELVCLIELTVLLLANSSVEKERQLKF